MWSILYYIRNNPEVLINSQKKRGESTETVEKAVALDKQWRAVLKEVEQLRKQRNELSKKIRENPELREEAKKISNLLKEKESELKRIAEEREKILLSIPNVLHESVPEGESDEDNVPIRYFGKPRVYYKHAKTFEEQFPGVEYEEIPFEPKPHVVLSEKFVDTLRAGKVSGSRFYYMFNDLVFLDFALMMYAMDYMSKKGYTVTIPPYLLGKTAYEGVTALSDFEEMIYKVEGEDLFLIATSEHPIAGYYMNEVLEIEELPKKFCGVSPCFRKEAGAHGKDTKGIFRVHQFHKIEQFVFCHPDESWDIHEELIQNAEELWKGLGIPYRVVNICTGDIGVVAAKKYDLEAWMPAQNKFREMVSASNCTDYQSYRLNIRYAKKRGLPSEGYVHTLNSTAIATSRAICAILENNQEEDGTVRIPKVLRKYLEPFENAPKDSINCVKHE
ncbi:MAG: serine--tRNA ligase [Thermoplasmata archaeon]|nr:MAG: serine--tRNA ligase [Thermoplasmata archaeon]